MPDGHASTPSFGPALLKAARELAPLRSLDDGLKSAYRDPREHPLVQGTPRDSEEALAGAVESGAIAAGRAANGRLMRLSFDLRAVGVWLSTHDNLSAPEMVDRFATDHAPLALLEEALAAAEAHMRGDRVLITADLGIADGAFTAYGCDLTDGYVRINADYTT